MQGAVLKKWTMPSDSKKLVEILLENYREETISSVYEAGFSGFGLLRTLVENGIENIVINPASIAISSADRVKTEKKDIEMFLGL